MAFCFCIKTLSIEGIRLPNALAAALGKATATACVCACVLVCVCVCVCVGVWGGRGETVPGPPFE